MAQIIKINNTNKMINSVTNEVIKKYDPNNKDLVLIIEMPDGSELKVNNSQIRIQYGGQITFDYLDEKYIVDDGYRDVLCKAGYIIMDYYNTMHCNDCNDGLAIRNELMQHILDTLKVVLDSQKATIVDSNLNHIKLIFSNDAYNFTIGFDTINSIVTKNQERSKNNLPFYPFDKNMDKFGTAYFSFFAEKKEGADPQGNRKFEIAEAFFNKFILFLNEFDNTTHTYRINSLPIKKRVVNWEGI